MAVYGEDGFNRSIHNIENSPFRTKFEKNIQTMKGNTESAVFQIMNHSH